METRRESSERGLDAARPGVQGPVWGRVGGSRAATECQYEVKVPVVCVDAARPGVQGPGAARCAWSVRNLCKASWSHSNTVGRRWKEQQGPRHWGGGIREGENELLERMQAHARYSEQNRRGTTRLAAVRAGTSCATHRLLHGRAPGVGAAEVPAVPAVSVPLGAALEEAGSQARPNRVCAVHLCVGGRGGAGGGRDVGVGGGAAGRTRRVVATCSTLHRSVSGALVPGAQRAWMLMATKEQSLAEMPGRAQSRLRRAANPAPSVRYTYEEHL